MTRAYLRFDPAWYDRKVLGVTRDGEPIPGWQPYPADALVAFLGCLDLAEQQPKRGWFRSERVLRELLRGPDGRGRRYARQVATLIAHGDLVVFPDGRLYFDGWDQWQEGDWKVAERVQRIRSRPRSVTAGVTVAVTPHVTGETVSSLSDGGRRSGGGGIYSGGGAPLQHGAPRPMSDDQRTEAIALNRGLLGSSEPEVRRAALRSLKRLDPETDWESDQEDAAPPEVSFDAPPSGEEAAGA